MTDDTPPQESEARLRPMICAIMWAVPLALLCFVFRMIYVPEGVVDLTPPYIEYTGQTAYNHGVVRVLTRDQYYVYIVMQFMFELFWLLGAHTVYFNMFVGNYVTDANKAV